MSSPIAKPGKTVWDRVLIAVHQKLSHGRRVERLAGILAQQIARHVGRGALRGLDVGCGDMRISEQLMAWDAGIQMTCTDLYDPSGDVPADDPRWRKYVKCSDGRLPFADRQFSFVLLVDVLHHVEGDAGVRALLSEARRVAAYVIVKEHIERGWLSRQLLRVMDFLGNYGYGIRIPLSYFTRRRYEQLVAGSGLVELAHTEPVPVYEGSVFSIFGADRLHFISVLGRA